VDFEILPDESLIMLHTAVRNAFYKDGSLISEGKDPVHEVHSISDWHTWSNSLEAEMSKRNIIFNAILW
jgi:hypothetical protein